MGIRFGTVRRTSEADFMSACLASVQNIWPHLSKVMSLFTSKEEAQWACIAHWFLPYIFVYQSMIKGCYMLNINAFRPVIHEKKMFQVFCYINLYKNVSLLQAWS